MFKILLLKDLILEKINFKAIPTGWFVGKCELCSDYKERAGFKFDDNKVVYNCWNCGTAAAYEELSGQISHKMRSILTRYGIDDSEISNVVNSAFFATPKDKSVITLQSVTQIDTHTPTISLPPNSYRLGFVDDFLDYQEGLVRYLISRNIDLDKYPFYFNLKERFLGRIIIPFFRNGQLIYWQARAIDPSIKKRYDNSPNTRDAIIFNFDKLNIHSPLPLFVTEGVFDAMPVDGIAILGSKLSEAHKLLIERSPRNLVFVLDKDKNGKSLGQTVLSLGHQITFAPDGAADINESVQRFGLIWTVNELMKNIPKSRDAALVSLNFNCR